MEALGESLLPCLFQLLEAARIPWPVAPCHSIPCFSPHISHSLLLASFTGKAPCDYVGSTRVIQNEPPSQYRSLSHTCNAPSPVPGKVAGLRYRMLTPWAGVFILLTKKAQKI